MSDVLVEMRAWKIVGIIKPDDWVEISGTYTPWEPIRPREVQNLTTGLTIEASGNLQVRTLIGAIVVIIVVALILIVSPTPTQVNPDPGFYCCR
ncbi:MAG: hypothetical protein NVS2B16_07430 [Chloroflexota bacterium]